MKTQEKRCFLLTVNKRHMHVKPYTLIFGSTLQLTESDWYLWIIDRMSINSYYDQNFINKWCI